MKIVGDKAVCETLHELIVPTSTAIVVVDMQNDFLEKGGVVDLRGEANAVKVHGIVSNTAAVIASGRAVGVRIVYVRYARTADHRYESPASIRWTLMKRGYTAERPSAIEGTWGAAIIDALAPVPGDLVFDKRRASAFFETDLDSCLRKLGIGTIILAGVSTHGCVEATARDAELRDYYVVVLEDCVAAYDESLHEAALVVMTSRYDVVNHRDVLGVWAPLKR